MPTKPMFESQPQEMRMDMNAVAIGIDAAYDCAVTCAICADACLGEDNVKELVTCIRLNQECADVCEVTGRIMARYTDRDWALKRMQVESCIIACRMCAEECERHSRHHEHCRICAESCRNCERICTEMLRSVPVTA